MLIYEAEAHFIFRVCIRLKGSKLDPSNQCHLLSTWKELRASILESEQTSSFCFELVPVRELPGACRGRRGGCREKGWGLHMWQRAWEGVSATPDGLTTHWTPGKAGAKETRRRKPSTPTSPIDEEGFAETSKRALEGPGRGDTLHLSLLTLGPEWEKNR